MFKQTSTLGVFLAVSSFFFFSVMDALGKWLSTDYSFAQITFFSSLFSLLPIIYMLKGRRVNELIATQKLHYHLLRGCIILAMRFSALFAFSTMAFADSFSIILTGPLILCALSPLLLKEKITAWQVTFVFIGFIGTLVVLRPGFSHFNVGVLGAFGAALCFALNTIVMKKMGPNEHQASVLFYGMAFNIVASGTLMIEDFILPNWRDLSLLMGCGLCAGLAQLAIFNALKHVSTSVTGMMQYTSIVWAGVIGYIIWNDIPDAYVMLGSIFIVASGISNVWYLSRKMATS